MGRSILRLPPWRHSGAPILTMAETVDWGIAFEHIPDLWKQSKGEGIKIAILDTGCDLGHQDLQGAFAETRNFSTSGGPNEVTDGQGHGTFCAGEILARQNQTGLIGVCPLATGAIGKVMGDDGSGQGDWVAAGIDWAISIGANVISMSLGSPDADPTMYAAIQRAVAKGVWVICAAGNEGQTGGDSVDYPGKFTETIAVAAFNKDGTVCDFSSRGPEVDIAAPGQDIISTWPGGRYAKLSGTSMATPLVAGCVALMLAKEKAVGSNTPIRTVSDLRAHLAKAATDTGPSGKDADTGFGLLRADLLLDSVTAPATPPAKPAPITAPGWPDVRMAATVNNQPATWILVPRGAKVTIQPAEAAA